MHGLQALEDEAGQLFSHRAEMILGRKKEGGKTIMLGKFMNETICPRRTFIKNFDVKVGENFNFGFDVVDALCR